MEGRDSVFGDALSFIEKNLASQDTKEAKSKKKKGAAGDPLKQGKPTQLKGEGEKDMKLQKMEGKKGAAGDPLKQGKPTQLKGEGEKDMKLQKMEGMVPEEPKDDEATKIKKLTEQEELADFEPSDLLQLTNGIVNVLFSSACPESDKKALELLAKSSGKSMEELEDMFRNMLADREAAELLFHELSKQEDIPFESIRVIRKNRTSENTKSTKKGLGESTKVKEGKRISERVMVCPRCDAPWPEMHSIDDMGEKWKCDNCGTEFSRAEGEEAAAELGLHESTVVKEGKVNEQEFGGLGESIKLIEGSELAQSVTALQAKAKEALDKGEYEAARGFCDRLEQIQLAVAEQESDGTPIEEPEEPEEPMGPEDKEGKLGGPFEEGKVMRSEKVSKDQEAFFQNDELQEQIDNILDLGVDFSNLSEAEKKKTAKLRNRGDVVFPAGSSKVKDDKDHFPINNKNQARNALARANQYKDAPPWYKGTLSDLVKKVAAAAKRKYKSMKVAKASETPGKGERGRK